MWILARPKVPYYGAYPNGFLHRARELLGVSIYTPVLHVCSGMVKDYPLRGFGPFDKTVDLDPALGPDFVMDVREGLPVCPEELGGPLWPAILADPPYTEPDADHYVPGSEAFPQPTPLLRLMLNSVQSGGRCGMLHYKVPRPQKELEVVNPQGKLVRTKVRFVACVGVFCGFDNSLRAYSVFEKEAAI